jgi:hypothetical protein
VAHGRTWLMGGRGSWADVAHGRTWLMGGRGSWADVAHGRTRLTGGRGSRADAAHGRTWLMGGRGSWADLAHGRTRLMGGPGSWADAAHGRTSRAHASHVALTGGKKARGSRVGFTRFHVAHVAARQPEGPTRSSSSSTASRVVQLHAADRAHGFTRTSSTRLRAAHETQEQSGDDSRVQLKPA